MLMRALCLILLLPLVSGCVSAIPEPADLPNPLCAGTRAARADLAATLGETPDAVIVTQWGERVVRSGARLIDQIDAGCAG